MFRDYVMVVADFLVAWFSILVICASAVGLLALPLLIYDFGIVWVGLAVLCAVGWFWFLTYWIEWSDGRKSNG